MRQLACNLVQNLFLFYAATGSSSSSTHIRSNSPGLTNNHNELADSKVLEKNSQLNQNWRKLDLAETLISNFIDECCTSGECFGEYLNLVKNVLLADKDCKYRVVFGQCDILNRIESLLHKEIRYLSDLERFSESLPSSCKKLP